MGAMEVEAEPLSSNIFKMSVRILNHTPITAAQCEDQDAIIMRTFASTHTILQAAGGEFVSMMDPLPGLAEFVSQCKNIGTWPVLVGEEARSQRDTILSSPIILYDYRKSPRKASAPFSMERRLTKCSPCGS
jgi:hydrogenase maturation protease